MSFSIAKGKTEFRYGMSDLFDLEKFLRSEIQMVGIAFCGRSNVGKSSLINALFGKTTARTSKTPGRTKEINIFTFEILSDNKPYALPQKVYLFDLPGYGHAKVSKKELRHWQLLIETFFSNVGGGVLVTSLQDARHPHSEADQVFNKYIRDFGLRTTLVFNKMDKLKTQKDKNSLKNATPILMKQYKWARDVHFVSAEKKDGIVQLEGSLLNFILGTLGIHG